MKTLREIWKMNGEKTPFAARMKFWALDTYVVVIGFGANTNPKDPTAKEYINHPIGICLTNDKPNRVFSKYPLYNELSVIPRFDKREWIIITDLNLERFERMDVHGLGSFIYFGKHKGKEIRDIINSDLKYIFFFFFEKYLIINQEVLDYLQLNFFDRIDNDAVMINNYRLQEIYYRDNNTTPLDLTQPMHEIKVLQSKMNTDDKFGLNTLKRYL